MKIYFINKYGIGCSYCTEDFSFFIVSYYSAYGPYSFQRRLYFRAAAPAYISSTTVATSFFHNFWIRSVQLLKAHYFLEYYFCLPLACFIIIIYSMVITHLNFCFLQNIFFYISPSNSPLLNTAFRSNLL